MGGGLVYRGLVGGGGEVGGEGLPHESTVCVG